MNIKSFYACSTRAGEAQRQASQQADEWIVANDAWVHHLDTTTTSTTVTVDGYTQTVTEHTITLVYEIDDDDDPSAADMPTEPERQLATFDRIVEHVNRPRPYGQEYRRAS